MQLPIQLLNNFDSFSDKPITEKGTNANVKAKKSLMNNSRVNSNTDCPECAQLQLAETTRMTA